TFFDPGIYLDIREQKFCSDSSIQIRGSLGYPYTFDSAYWVIEGDTFDAMPNLQLNRIFGRETHVELFLLEQNLCPDPGKLTVIPLEYPNFDIALPYRRCLDDTIQISGKLKNELMNGQYFWTSNLP